MGLYNFQKRFVSFIESGEKCQTIRSVRSRPDKPGNVLYLYTGLSRKGARLLMRAVCTSIEEIEFHPRSPFMRVAINGIELSKDECEALATCDGFQSFGDMAEFFRERLPFKGHLIRWRKELP